MAKYNPFKRKYKKRGRLSFKKRNKSSHPYPSSNNTARPLGPENFKTLGAHSDTSFIDSSSTVYYPWHEINPLYHDKPIKPKGKSGRLPSLKLLCSRIVAENCGALNTSMLECLSWPCIKMIWNYILVSHNDSMGVFITFATSMFKQQEFRCHSPLINTIDPLITIRQDCLTNCLIPNLKNHRIENLFSNINIEDFTFYFNSLKLPHVLFLDFSATPDLLKRESFLLLLKLNNLAGLDVSNNNHIDDIVLLYLITAIKSGMLPNLRVLRLSNCKQLSKAVIEKLFLVSSIPQSSLSLIICDDIFPTDFHDRLANTSANKVGYQVHGTNWINYGHEWDHSKLLMKFPLAFQYHYLLKELSSRLPNVSSSNPTNNDHILLDIMFCDQQFGFDSNYYMLDYAFKRRLNSRNRFTSTERCLLIDKNLDVKPQLTITKTDSKATTETIFASVNPSKKRSVIKPRSKPKRRNVNVAEYF